MEPPSKRARLSLSEEPEDDGDDIDIHEARAQNDQRLKSIFEGIFEKYGRDFTDVGDEIDLQTGKIIVNNGHIQEMEGDGKTGGETLDWEIERERELSVASDGKADLHSALRDTDNHLAAGMDGADDSPRPQATAPSIQEPHPGPATLHQPSWEAGSAQHGWGADNDDDDGASVDSLLDNTLRIESILDGSAEQRGHAETTGKLVTEKAKPAADAPAQSQGGRRSEAVEEVWRVPEIDASFSTPTWNRSRPAPSVNLARSQSPPEAGSLWSLPARSSRRASRKGHVRIMKGKQQRRQQKVTQSSPVVCDWSFAETPDGDESDDPLQEDYEPSPTPKRSIHVRGAASTKKEHSPRQMRYQCSDCKQVYVRDGYITHLKDIASRPFDGQHDQAEVTRRLDTLASEPALESQFETTLATTPSILTGSMKASAQSRVKRTVEDDPTPTKKRARNVIQPDEAKLIITMRQVQGKKWNEILDCLPHTKLTSLIQWNRTHWSDRRANPPLLSKPWSEAERAILDKFKEQQGLSWTTIREGLPGRPHAEIEFELLQLWADEDTL
ncbi:Myb-like DNA-binding domain protein [Aspergillus homomorphus CBS 101889]|uniref:Myb-like DNA-binding domain protein n=1 Tax=Aspergillus homomorphus (strain CBS 101889) TaxID=1450537 RepID=A0A395HPE9_ASPHC|nr:hypothetical protein BO97DRAFT_153963 [Aspergillus homomorphus CBS 101889]RAL09811.1 hypothetical protein BO97DRAFT_153963 [Aspergillus homomorphus CBS 101889]